MNKIMRLLMLFISVSSAVFAIAQTDTGGGMGGTGVKQSPNIVTPAKSEGIETDECTKDKSIAIYQRKSMAENKVKTQSYACEGQTLETTKDEHIEIYMRSGEKITVLEKSRIRISKNK